MGRSAPPRITSGTNGRRTVELATLSPNTIEALKRFLPKAASVSNPVDMLASASADHYTKAIALLQADETVDRIRAIFVPPLVTNPVDAADVLARGGGWLTPAEAQSLLAVAGIPMLRARLESTFRRAGAR